MVLVLEGVVVVVLVVLSKVLELPLVVETMIEGLLAEAMLLPLVAALPTEASAVAATSITTIAAARTTSPPRLRAKNKS